MLKDGSLKIVSATETLCKMASRFCYNWFLKISVFCQKSQNLVHFRPQDLVQKISAAYGPRTYLIMIGRDFRLPVSAFARVARKCFNGKYTAKLDFPIGHFILP